MSKGYIYRICIDAKNREEARKYLFTGEIPSDPTLLEVVEGEDRIFSKEGTKEDKEKAICERCGEEVDELTTVKWFVHGSSEIERRRANVCYKCGYELEKEKKTALIYNFHWSTNREGENVLIDAIPERVGRLLEEHIEKYPQTYNFSGFLTYLEEHGISVKGLKYDLGFNF